MLPYFQFHHIGVACNDIEKTAGMYVDAGYSRTEAIIDPLQNVNVCVLTKEGMPKIELLAPVDEKSPICKILQKSSGATPYHVCYTVLDMEKAIADLRKLRFIPTSKPKMSNVFDALVCFLFHKDIGLIEIIQNHKL